MGADFSDVSVIHHYAVLFTQAFSIADFLWRYCVDGQVSSPRAIEALFLFSFLQSEIATDRSLMNEPSRQP